METDAVKRCPNGCCDYEPEVGRWFYNYRREASVPVKHCPEDGTRLNADGTMGYSGGKLQGRCECGRWTHHTMRDGFSFWGDIRGPALEETFCSRCGTRLNADGTADPGSVAWADHEAMEVLRACDVDTVHTVYEDSGRWFCAAGLDTRVEADDPAEAVRLAKAALEGE